MLKIEEKVIYKAFGLFIKSDISLPELLIGVKSDTVDIEIKIGDLSQKKKELSVEPNKFTITENKVMFQIPSIATFFIENGKLITVSPEKDADEDLIRLYILGSCMGAILMQRKIFPLHGSAVAINGKAYAIVGESGAGKSTLASAFLSQGYRLLSDDVIAVTLSQENNLPLIVPSYPQQKLWKDSLKSLGMGTNNYRSIFGRENKYCIPVTSMFSTENLPLAGIIELVKKERNEIIIRPIEKLEKLQTLYTHTYRNFFIPKLGLMAWHFQVSTDIVDKIELYQLHRPIAGANALELVSTILNTINEGDITYE